ncbi:MAG: hypothetical protein ACJ780_10245 [Solirubrobacteraceae bacterium]|jgi:hypothetical protein
MIGKDQIAEACRYLDALSEEGHEFEDLLRERGIDPEGLFYVANQRAIRAAMIATGGDPRTLPRDRMSTVNLSPEAKALLMPLTLAWLDAFVAGRVACDPNDRIQRYPEEG